MAVNNRRQRRRRRHRQRVAHNRLVDRENPLEFKRYRFRPDTILFVVNLLRRFLERDTLRSCALTPLLQVMATLRFLAIGGFYSFVADTFDSLSPSTVCRTVKDVCHALCQMSRQFIRMPARHAADGVKKHFYSIAGFPNVLGCIDGTYIKIQAPSENEPDFLNRKGYHSLNVQMISDGKFRILNCVAKWPGSVHDSRIYRDSHISIAFENGQYPGLLLGDSGYPCKPHLMTPYPVPSSDAEARFNNAHARTRVVIEQAFGILKKRFPCLHSGLRTTPEKACHITLACAVLHNIGIDHNDILDIDDGVSGYKDVCPIGRNHNS
ncbi:putative nuclease HARBI1 [Saccostrea echinata]|uniref:putative nuclease HARBI1 n=1 Tax=Saccostrea echinata TaxID=191078 RepID=UPI002A83163D|nr:putative nuclease HARBI1 [Saccostrea echinata]